MIGWGGSCALEAGPTAAPVLGGENDGDPRLDAAATPCTGGEVPNRGRAAGPLGGAPGTNAPDGGRDRGGKGGRGAKLGGAPGGTRIGDAGDGGDARGAASVGSREKGLSEDGTGRVAGFGAAREVSTRAVAPPPVDAGTALPASWPQAKHMAPSQARPQLGQRCTVTGQA